MKNLLLITSHFLPSKNVGAVRPSKFAKYLPEFGWQPIILTPHRGQNHMKHEIEVPLYYAQYPDPDKIFALGRRFLRKPAPQSKANRFGTSTVAIANRKQAFVDWLMLPDEGVTWIPFAIKKGIEIAKIHHIDALLSTVMDFSCHLVGLFLARRLTCPWIADFRDPWLTNTFSHYPTKLHRKIHAILERKVIEAADQVITVSEPILQDFLERYPDQNRHKFKIIYNGYDSEDFINLETQRPARDPVIRIVHSGSFYPGREPLPFLQAVKLLDAPYLDKIRITFLGNNALGLEAAVRQMGLSEVVALKDYLPYRQSLQYLGDADILLVIPGHGQGSLTTKLFEYLKLGKFILALTPAYNEAMLNLLKEANVGLMVDPESPPEIAKGLTELIGLALAGQKPEPNWTFVEQFDRKNLTGQLAEILDEMVHLAHSQP